MGIDAEVLKDCHGIVLKREKPVMLNGVETEYCSYISYASDKNMAPEGKTVISCYYAADYDYWKELYQDKEKYNAEKRKLAEGIATAVSGWWTGGLGIPLASNLIMCAWGMGEALIDVDHIMNGEAVAFYKQKGDWELAIGLGKSAGKKTDKKLKFTYYDYLRLFLLFKKSDDKINRIEDLIQLNINGEKNGFKMAGANTMVRVEAKISMKYLFITKLFTLGSNNTSDGRHKFSFAIYDGY
jgi:hypothetical protein